MKKIIVILLIFTFSLTVCADNGSPTGGFDGIPIPTIPIIPGSPVRPRMPVNISVRCYAYEDGLLIEADEVLYTEIEFVSDNTGEIFHSFSGLIYDSVFFNIVSPTGSMTPDGS